MDLAKLREMLSPLVIGIGKAGNRVYGCTKVSLAATAADIAASEGLAAADKIARPKSSTLENFVSEAETCAMC